MGGTLCKEACQSFCDDIDSHSKQSINSPWYTNVEVDWNGCRKFSNLPSPGIHPRLFFTKEELPRIAARFTHSDIGPSLRKVLNSSRNEFFKKYDFDTKSPLPDGQKSDPSRATIDEFFRYEPNRNVSLLGTYVYGYLYEDEEAKSRAKQFALFYAKVILKAHEIATTEDVKDKPYDIWHNNKWDVEAQGLFGGTCFALMYDIMFNDLTEEEQVLMRKAITTSIRRRRGWGMGWPTRRIQSNWAAYHGDLYNLAAVVEDEEGFDHEVWSMFEDLMVHYLDYAIYDSGHPIEDAYSLNLAFREGSLCFLAMARRGHNLFNHPHYKNIWTKWLPYALEPNNSGKIYGGSSGNIWRYPTSAIMAKYMFPKNATVDHVYRHFMSELDEPYARLNRIQCRLPVIAFAVPISPMDEKEQPVPEKLNLPLDFVCRSRGKVIMRSDWSKKAMWFTFDARPDGFLIGHDACSRGAFVLNSEGRSWGFCPEWKWFRECSDYSLPLIDNVGQEAKAPFVKIIEIVPRNSFTFASADLTYAYNWKWSNWVNEGKDCSKQGFEAEPNDPRDFGYNVWWSPQKVFGERNVGFNGLFVWRKRIATVENVTRSTIMVRAKKPFVIIADDIEKDDENHEYSWALTTPRDVSYAGFDGNQAVLKDEMDRQLIVRNITSSVVDLRCLFRSIEKQDDKIPATDQANQLVFSCTAKKVQFRFLLYSLTGEAKHLESSWSNDGDIVQVRNPNVDEITDICVGCGKRGETTMRVI